MNDHSVFDAALHLDVALGDLERTVIVANNPMTRSLGMSGVTNLTSVTGMLFVYDTDCFVPFTADRTLIPLVLAFYDENGEMLSFQEIQPGDPGPFWPPSHFRYAVEMIPEFFVAGKLKVKKMPMKKETQQ